MDRRSTTSAIAGAAMALVGSAVLAGLILIAYGRAPAFEQTYYRLGLALPGLIAAVGEILVMAGVWMLWSAVHRR